MNNQVIHIGIIGPKIQGMGGYGENELRTRIENAIDGILKKYQEDGFTIIGLTGLGLGAEQCFAECCLRQQIDYIAYLPFENQHDRWAGLDPTIIDSYTELLERSIESYLLTEGQYSPKKVLSKNRQVVKDSDVIIYVNNTLRVTECPLLSFAHKMNKKVFIIEN